MTRQDGFILVAALWMVAALAFLASAYAAYAVRTAPSGALPEERLRAEAAIRAGIDLCAFRQLSWPKAARPDAGAFSAQVGLNRIDVAYRSEAARVDLNAAPRELLAALFARLGAAPAVAGNLADRVVAWRGRLSDSDREREAAIYAKAGLGYRPFGAPFDNPLEIAWLPGMTPELAQRALSYLTIYGGKLDPFAADPVVLAAVPGLTAAAARTFAALGSRPTRDAGALARIAGSARDYLSADPGNYVRAEIVASVGERRVRAEIVLKIPEAGPSPYEIMSWRDDFDGGG
jgi:general secretion pathway protein K